MNIKYNESSVILETDNNFDLGKTLDCGQAFRWEKTDDNIWCGVKGSTLLKIKEENNIYTFYTTKREFEEIWFNYFDLSRNYCEIFDSFKSDESLTLALDAARGIHILRQEPWETLCSFIISQNNNIPRIKGIITRLCENFGEKLDEGLYGFPTAEKIASLSIDDLAPIRSGFRAKYILAAAKSFAAGEIDVEKISALPIDQAREELKKLYGVGDKVADCVLLFGFGFMNAFPRDVWMKRVVEKLYDGQFPEKFNTYAGIAQQILFHYARITKLAEE